MSNQPDDIGADAEIQELQKSSEAYVKESLQAILSGWKLDQLELRKSGDYHELEGSSNSALFKGYRKKFGDFVSYAGLPYQPTISINENQDGSTEVIYANYIAFAMCQKAKSPCLDNFIQARPEARRRMEN